MRKVLYNFTNEEMLPKALLFLEKYAPERLKKSLKFIHKQDQYNCAIAYILLCILCDKPIGELIYGKNGRPFLKSNVSTTEDISIAHTNGMVAVGISNDKIGVDVEKNNNVSPEVTNTTFSSSEKKQAALNPELKAFFWTAKEAISKLYNDDWYSFPRTNLLYNNGRLADLTNELVKFSEKKIGDYVVTVATDDFNDVQILRVTTADIENFMNKYINKGEVENG